MTETTPESINAQLEQVLAGEALAKSGTNRRLLRYLVQRSLAGGESPKELEIAIDVFGRDATFHGAEDSGVRVAMRSLRQKLLEHYAGSGRHDALVFDIPKGAYRVTVLPRADARVEPGPAATVPAEIDPLPVPEGGARSARRWRLAAAAGLPLLLLSLAANVYYWQAAPRRDAALEQVRHSALWAPIAQSRRPVMFVLGDLFMYTQSDAKTGRTLTVRDSQINSSEDLRAFLASNPTLSAERGLRYSTLIQKSTAVGMVDILQIVGDAGRQIEVRLRDELRAEDLQRYDIVYVGPITRLGPLAGDYRMRSRYRFDAATSGITDTVTGKTHLPEGGLGDHHKDYALVARYPGPSGNHIMVFTSGGRNAGLLQVVRALTSAEGMTKFWGDASNGAAPPAAFEALVAVSGYKQTDLAADLVELHAWSDAQSELAAAQ
jgi:hypothetical protein